VLVGFDDGSSAIADVFVRVDDTPLPPPAPLLTIGNASVNEGDGGGIPFSITSTAGVMQVVTSRIVSAVALGGPPANDSTDDVSITPLGCDVGTLIFPGVPCVGVITFTTPKTVGEAENDIDGTNSLQLTVILDNGAPVTANGVVAVHDITSAVPEPSSASVLLLGLLFLGLWRIRSKHPMPASS
jgi:hypothetical protein